MSLLHITLRSHEHAMMSDAPATLHLSIARDALVTMAFVYVLVFDPCSGRTRASLACDELLWHAYNTLRLHTPPHIRASSAGIRFPLHSYNR